MKKTFFVFSLVNLLFVFLLVACSTSPSDSSNNSNDGAMSWISNPLTEYDSASYLTAIGAAPSVEQAQDNARANIAKIFFVRVRQQSFQSTQVQNTDNNEIVKNYGGQNTRALTDDIVEGVEIVRRGYNKNDNQWYALAILPKTRATRVLRARMDELDDKVGKEIARVDSASPIARIGILRRIDNYLHDRDRLFEKYRIVSSGDYPSKHANYPFKNLLVETQQSFAIRVFGSGDVHRYKLVHIFKRGLTDNGFRVSDQGMYEIEIKAQVAEIVFRANWYWQEMLLTWQIKKQGSVEGESQLVIKTSSVDKTRLEKRLQEEAVRMIETPLMESIDNIH